MIDVPIEEDLKKSYLDYALSVIVGRALPDVRDGLKPVQRRIIYAMYSTGNVHNKPHKKSARIVGEVLGKYHPHGDSAIYDALVRMAQDFSMRYELVDGQGNFGSIDGDSPAAMRYTEVRLTRLAEEMLRDINKETVPMRDNFDGTLKEPVVLPTVIPNILLNGSSGIAVGMATNMAPHNLKEIGEAIIAYVKGADEQEILDIVKGPDFPTGGEIVGIAGIKRAYLTGKGTITLRGTIERKENELLIRSIPYQLSKATLVEKIAKAIAEKKIDGAVRVEDRSDKQGIEVAVIIKKGADPEIVEKLLYKKTPLQQTFNILNLAIIGKQPKIFTLYELIKEFVDFREEIIIKRSKYELREAEYKKHMLDGIKSAIDKIDEVIEKVKKAENKEKAIEGLIKLLSIDEQQAKAVLEMKIQRLVALEREEIEKQIEELTNKISYLNEMLNNKQKRMDKIIEETREIIDKYGDERRTKILENEEEFDEIIIQDEPIVITLSEKGYIKRVKKEEYREQRRGGTGVIGLETKDDKAKDMIVARTIDDILLFSNKGRVFKLKAYEIPPGSRQSKGKHISALLKLEDEEIEKILPYKEESYLIFITSNGTVKRTPTKIFKRITKSGVRALTLIENNRLVDVKQTTGEDSLALITKNGMAILFNENQLREKGRTAIGVRGIRLKEGDEVRGAAIGDEEIFIVTEKGYGKKVKIDQFREQKRGGMGVKAIKLSDKTGLIVGAKAVKEDSEIILTSTKGKIIVFSADQLRDLSRYARGVKVMRLKDNEKVAGLAIA